MQNSNPSTHLVCKSAIVYVSKWTIGPWKISEFKYLYHVKCRRTAEITPNYSWNCSNPLRVVNDNKIIEFFPSYLLCHQNLLACISTINLFTNNSRQYLFWHFCYNFCCIFATQLMSTIIVLWKTRISSRITNPF